VFCQSQTGFLIHGFLQQYEIWGIAMDNFGNLSIRTCVILLKLTYQVYPLNSAKSTPRINPLADEIQGFSCYSKNKKYPIFKYDASNKPEEKQKEYKKMKISQLIGGIICLAIAALLTVLNLTLSPDKIMFQMGDVNMPWVPVVALGVIGIVLTITAFTEKKPEATEGEPKPEVVPDPEKMAKNKRFETVGWGLFLIMVGGFSFVPHSIVNKGLWSVGIGLIFLGLNYARYLNQIKMSGFTTFLGILSVISGIAQFFGLSALEGAAFFILLGFYLLMKPWFEKNQLFGKVEAS
jgi:hypothetical protein